MIPDPVADLAPELFLCRRCRLDRGRSRPENTIFAWTDGWPDLEQPLPVNTYGLILTDICGDPTISIVRSVFSPPFPDLGTVTTFCPGFFYLLPACICLQEPLNGCGRQLSGSSSVPCQQGWYTLSSRIPWSNGQDSIYFSAVYWPYEWDIPNLFTPNRDSVNDVFRVFKTCDAVIHMKIFDRWSEWSLMKQAPIRCGTVWPGVLTNR